MFTEFLQNSHYVGILSEKWFGGVAPLDSVEPIGYHPGPLNSLTMDRNLKERIHGDAEGGIGASRMMTNAESLNSAPNIATTNGRLDTQGVLTRQSSSSIVESITYCQSQRQTTTSSQHSSTNQTRDNSHPSIKSTVVKGESEVTLNEPNPTENQYYIEKEMQDPLEGLPPTPIPTPPPPPKVERLPLPAISPLQPRKRPSVVINVSEDEELEVSEELAKLYYDICVSGLGVSEIWDRVANGEY
ncbi:hypothetical protein BCR33DRAFT_789118 [Rhizoclosmatium globosum]|uniref:Uncharacterized protein n=1 Tax=Rhizoclosmatium globosum TaxID=329046 RepID=A0A1Y2BTW3_9FUNG|nr:hypothetical protein BCR33DRAFT_789118 [Rhizoclosmatium globosum]|eukprot:ORY38208.1 hypothetical protein BCR33DRAFT_789118 [Rhizoclosmatium globosum]